jgi:hypothetical protein
MSNQLIICEFCPHIKHTGLICPMPDCVCTGEMRIPYNPANVREIQKKMTNILTVLFKGKGYTYPELMVGTQLAIFMLPFDKVDNEKSSELQ